MSKAWREGPDVEGGDEVEAPGLAPGKRSKTARARRGAPPRWPGKRSLTQHLAPRGPEAIARRGVIGKGSALPHADRIQESFGHHDVTGIEAHVGGDAAEASQQLGAHAYAVGNSVAFGTAPDLHTAAHEAAHVVQQRDGVQLKAIDGGASDVHEQHADAVADAVVAGRSAAALLDAAPGASAPAVQRKSGPDTGGMPALDPDDITAHELLEQLPDIMTIVLGALHFNKSGELHPFARYLNPAAQLTDAMFSHPAVHALLTPFHDKVDGLIAPEPVDPIVDKARAARSMFGAGVGPAHHVYMDSVGWALGNALTRTFQHALMRMLPRYVQATNPRIVGKDAKGEDWWTDDGPPHATTLAVSHPLDRIVAYGLCARDQVAVDAQKFAKEHPELVKVARDEVRVSRAITLKFPWERNLWHWVEATAADPKPVSAEEVARELFGNEDQAFRLTPMAPLFGFRNLDVAKFVPQRRTELDKLAAEHHPHPQIANQSEIAAVTSSHTEAEAREAHRDHRFDGGTITLENGQPLHTIPKLQMPGFPQPEHGQPPSPAPQPPAPIKVFPVRDDVDPAMELAASQGGDKLAKARAKQAAAAAGPGPKRDEAAVYERVSDCIDLVEPTKQAFLALAVPTATLDKQLGSFLTTQREAVQTCFADPDAEYALVDQQGTLLKRIAQGAVDTAAHLPLYGGVNKDDKTGSVVPKMTDLPSFARAPIEEAAQAFDSALAGLAFPEIAKPRIERAEHLAKMLRISVLEQSLHETRPTLQNAMDTPGDRQKDTAAYDPHDLHRRNDNLLFELSRARVQMEHDPAAAEKEFTKTQERAGDYSFEIAIVANLEALDALWSAIEGTEDFWKSGFDKLGGDLIQKKNRAYYKIFKDKVYTPYKDAVAAKDSAKKDAAKKEFDKLVKDDDFQKHFEEVQKHITDDAKHKKWTKIIVAIAIAVVAMGLGQWYFGAYLAAGGGVFGAAVGGALVETGVGTVLNKIILDADPTLGGLVTGFVGAGIMYGILGKALMAGRAAGAGAELAQAAEKASLLKKAGTLAVDTTKELVMVQAIGMVQGQIANLMDHGKLLSEAELKEMFVHNIAGLVGMKIGQRVVDVTLDPMKPLRNLARQNSINVDALIAQKAALEDLAKRVQDTKDPAARKVLAEKLVDHEKAFLDNVRETRERLIELAEKNPGKVNAHSLDNLKAMPDHVQDTETLQAQAMMSLEEVGPNLYRADARAFDAILALHKQSGDKLVGVHTDANTGLRSLEFKTPEGGVVKIKEKLGDVGERAAPPVPAAEAKRFEDWLEHEMGHADPLQADTQRQRLRDYYARDPQAAIQLAERYGFKPQSLADTAALATKPTPTGPEHPTVKPKSEAERAYDQYVHERRGEQPQMSRVGEEPIQSRSDFEAWYKAGYEYDPVSRRWTIADARTTKAGGALPPSTGHSVVLGSVHSEAVGHEALRKLVHGEAEALRMVGIEPPPGFDPRTTEWGLGRRKSDGKIVLVRGDAGEVNWAHIPDVEALAHSHPLIDPVTGETRAIKGQNGRGEIDASNALALGASAKHSDLVWFLPSTGDLRFVALGGQAHAVMTPFVHLGEGRIGNPRPGLNADTVDIHIVSAEAIGTYGTSGADGPMIVYKGKVRVMAGEHEIGTYDIYQTFHDGLGDLPQLSAPPHTPLPANHPIARAMRTPTAVHSEPLGHVQPTTLAHLDHLDVKLTDNLKKTLTGLDADSARRLHELADLAMDKRVTGVAEWLAHLETKSGRDLVNAMVDLESAVRALAKEPSLRITLDGNGGVHYVDGAKASTVPAAPKDPPTIISDVKAQIAGDKDFEWHYSDADATRAIAEGRKLKLTDKQIHDLLRIAQRRDQEHPNPAGGTTTVKKHIKPDELIQQMHNYVETVLPQEHPYRITSKEQFKEFADELRSAAERAGLPTNDIRVQGSALRNPDARDIDIAILIDEHAFDAQLVKVFKGKVTLKDSAGRYRPVDLSIEGLEALVKTVRSDEAGAKNYNALARTLAHAFEHRTIRVQDMPALDKAKAVMASKFGSLDITVMSNRGYLNREPFMMLPQ